MATLKDVAKRAGVSVTTTSRVIRGLPYVREELRLRVLQAASELGYQVNEVARSMRLGSSKSLGLIVRDMRSANFAAICAAAEEVAAKNNYELFVCNSDRSPEKEGRYITSLLERQVDALLVFPADDAVNNLEPAHRAGKPVVVVSGGVNDIKADRVDVSDEKAATIATQYLLKQGHQNIAFLAWGMGIPSGRLRLQGYQYALQTAGIPVSHSMIEHCGYDISGVPEAIERFLQLRVRPTALIISATNLTPAALAALSANGVEIPDELSVIAFDDRDTARLHQPPIHVMKRDVESIGRHSVEVALRRLANPRAARVVVHIEFELLERLSVSSVPSISSTRFHQEVA